MKTVCADRYGVYCIVYRALINIDDLGLFYVYIRGSKKYIASMTERCNFFFLLSDFFAHFSECENVRDIVYERQENLNFKKVIYK